MNLLGLIVGRAGSRGVPGKNAALVGGRPCVCWTIDDGLAALSNGDVGVLAVSTDCGVVRGEAEAAGLAVIDRPASLAGDGARVDDVLRHGLGVMEGRLDCVFDGVVCLYANVPVRPGGLIGRACAMMRTTGCDSVQSYAPVGKHHPMWTAVVDPSTGGVGSWGGGALNGGVYRRQDLPVAHVPDGGVLVVRRGALMGELVGVEDGPHAFLGLDRRGVVTGEGSVIDIDSDVDLLLADAVLLRAAESSLEERAVGSGVARDEVRRVA